MQSTRQDEEFFNLTSLGHKIVSLLNNMLRERLGNDIKHSIENFKRNAEELEVNLNHPRALKLLIELIITNSWYYRTPFNFDEEFNRYVRKYQSEGFKTENGKKELIRLVNNLAPNRIRSKAVEKIKTLTDQLRESSIKDWTQNLYRLAMKDKTAILGEKGRDNYLRDFGYFDRIPMDRHEMRFIVRTGIYHACSPQGESDPLEKRNLQKALVNFCKEYLANEKIGGVDLREAPGLVDLFVWYYCSKEKYNICGKVPSCGKCLLSGYCLFSILSGIANQDTTGS